MFSFNNIISVRSIFTLFMVTALTVLVSGCGGSSSDGDEVSTSSISGSVFASHVNGAGCEIQNSGGATISGPFNTDSSGGYNINVPTRDLANDLVLICNGGTYIDEVAGGDPITAGTLSAYVAGGTLSNGDSIHATPGSTILQQMITTHSMSMVVAQGVFNDAFGYIPDMSIEPTDATAPVDGASDDELLAGLRAATFSQLIYDLDLNASEQFSLLTALARDLSDDILDGEDSSGPITFGDLSTSLPATIQAQFTTALMNFHGGVNDATGLEAGQVFGTTVFTRSYKVEYVSMMDAMVGKSQFQIKLTNLAGTLVQSGKDVSLMPMMSMNSMMHATPVDGCTEDNDLAGTYNCTLYYTMSSMGGYWDLKVVIGGMMMEGMIMGGEEAHFYPSVMMAMGDTVSATLKNSVDTFEMMEMPAVRPYSLFKSDLTGENDNHTFEIFIAAEVSMMSYPAVYQGVILSAGTTDELSVTSMSVRMTATPDVIDSWVTAVSTGDGYWTAIGITALTNGSEGTIYVQMDINGVQYSNTIDGAVANSDNGYAIFTVTPGSSMSM